MIQATFGLAELVFSKYLCQGKDGYLLSLAQNPGICGMMSLEVEFWGLAADLCGSFGTLGISINLTMLRWTWVFPSQKVINFNCPVSEDFLLSGDRGQDGTWPKLSYFSILEMLTNIKHSSVETECFVYFPYCLPGTVLCYNIHMEIRGNTYFHHLSVMSHYWDSQDYPFYNGNDMPHNDLFNKFPQEVSYKVTLKNRYS